jgi:hypothetical protein
LFRSSRKMCTKPWSSNCGKTVSHRVIAEHAIGSNYLPGCRAAHAIDVIRSAVVEHATGHVAYFVVRIGG